MTIAADVAGAVAASALASVAFAARTAAPRAASGSRTARPAGTLAAIGRAVRSMLTTPSAAAQPMQLARSVADLDDRRLGLTVLAAGAAGLIRWWAAIVVVVISLVLARLARRAEVARAADAREQAAPVVIDLVRAGVAGGATARSCLRALATIGPDAPRSLAPLAPAIATVVTRLDAGVPFTDAVAALADATPQLRGLAAALASSERLGVAIGPTLDVLAVDAQLAVRRRAEARARRLPVLLLFPLVVCTLPAFGLLAVVPLLLSGLSSVRW